MGLFDLGAQMRRVWLIVRIWLGSFTQPDPSIPPTPTIIRLESAIDTEAAISEFDVTPLDTTTEDEVWNSNRIVLFSILAILVTAGLIGLIIIGIWKKLFPPLCLFHGVCPHYRRILIKSNARKTEFNPKYRLYYYKHRKTPQALPKPYIRPHHPTPRSSPGNTRTIQAQTLLPSPAIPSLPGNPQPQAQPTFGQSPSPNRAPSTAYRQPLPANHVPSANRTPQVQPANRPSLTHPAAAMIPAARPRVPIPPMSARTQHTIRQIAPVSQAMLSRAPARYSTVNHGAYTTTTSMYLPGQPLTTSRIQTAPIPSTTVRPPLPPFPPTTVRPPLARPPSTIVRPLILRFSTHSRPPLPSQPPPVRRMTTVRTMSVRPHPIMQTPLPQLPPPTPRVVLRLPPPNGRFVVSLSRVQQTARLSAANPVGHVLPFIHAVEFNPRVEPPRAMENADGTLHRIRHLVFHDGRILGALDLDVEETCFICFEELQVGETVPRIQHPCIENNNFMHQACLEKWLNHVSPTGILPCPICRQALE